MVMTKPKIRTGARAATPKPEPVAKTTVTTGAAAKRSPKAPATGLTFSPAGHRYKLDGLPVTGVTTLIGEGVPKGALIPWSAEMAGLWALRGTKKPLDESERGE